MPEMITSVQNPGIKNVMLLIEKPRARREQNLMVVEGLKETSLAVAGGFAVEELLYCREIAPAEDLAELLHKLPAKTRRVEVSLQVFSRIAYRGESGGVIALAIPRRPALSDLQLSGSPLLLVLETVEKPGNLGAILRTADAAGIDAVIICDPQTDITNPNAIRSSVGTIFTMPVVTVSSDEAIRWMKDKGIAVIGTALTATRFYHETDLRPPSAIVMGSEAHGLSETWLKGSDTLVKVPMRGKIDSMNVSATAAIVVFEAMRQRNFGK